jgi:sugar/nucleoside kinase (ribokinase family)
MFTFLGASSELTPEDINETTFRDAAIVVIEGYLLFNKDLMVKALDVAKAAGALVALDLASFTVVEESLMFLKTEVIPKVDILIANEDEAKAYTGHDDEDAALAVLSENVSIAVLKVGRKGSYISADNKTVRISAMGSGEAKDTTGAGDLWAAGFLYGLVNGYPIELCGKLASACGYEVCQVTGADIPDDGWKRIKEVMAEF